jgi:hypothetical protein
MVDALATDRSNQPLGKNSSATVAGAMDLFD